VEDRLGAEGDPQTKIVIVSDHGFADFDFKVHLNRWLIEHGYLVTAQEGGSGSLQDVDWSHSQAYAVGLNSVYINLEGREGQGSVPVGQGDSLVNKIRAELSAWQGPDGRPVVRDTWSQREAFEGPLAAYGPDIVVGYSPGYRASQGTGLGRWKGVTVQPNHDHWGADHCMDPNAVPGVLFCNQGLRGFPNPSYRDFPALTIGETLGTEGSATPPVYSEEDQDIVEERLRSLGYL